MTIELNVNFPALDRLVDVLADKKLNLITCDAVKPEIACDAPVAPVAAEEEAVDEVIVEMPKTAQKPEKAAKTHSVDDLAKAAMKLRDKDPANMKRITARYPEFGIKSLADLDGNDEAIASFAEMLIEMGAEL